jgi:hypothetical protein
MGNRTSGYGDLCNPDFSAVLSFHVQQEKPDGSAWSVVFFLDGLEQTGSRRFFDTEAEARDYGNSQMR